jgi:hypothetical protein
VCKTNRNGFDGLLSTFKKDYDLRGIWRRWDLTEDIETLSITKIEEIQKDKRKLKIIMELIEKIKQLSKTLKLNY